MLTLLSTIATGAVLLTAGGVLFLYQSFGIVPRDIVTVVKVYRQAFELRSLQSRL
ncbi:MAG: hypothetical protein AABZ53_02295 [Planctomycetota bacterium]